MLEVFLRLRFYLLCLVGCPRLNNNNANEHLALEKSMEAGSRCVE